MENTLYSVLNKQVANWTVLYTKLHNFHWNVKGPHFFTLHSKFEELYNEAAANLDSLAERVLSIGGKPVATLAACLNTASITEAEGSETAEQMVETIARDFSILVDELKLAMETADQADDEATADMLLGIRSGLEKHIWMLKSFLQ
ncbi:MULTISPECIES: Dps family protein [Brevibacillus]|uniref:DNA starvation/stationary phase protection protein n=1 Tax=Brevibacillus porteri TaxID=2126350 RepID=A0ABX5FQB6_9BACL|nr:MULTISPECIES: Dps family protein [Brevibacillus]MDC0763184.1 DNA starvation/stationary phase protection protein [Brevibacillus sp. AG]MED1800609.1 DNA starvation/stationary phase protection protein [Brevibacillus porteri]MED2134763.1 DNA starvation/stationary phase protection protein [Brevibacillus porteri]MED2745580.1 DNA starvation/stationary phase protection protein [Brevibacillus porteri]MED2815579.1 DNA starvation/stationary phase protection protein [Brevibacillus porteri]